MLNSAQIKSLKCTDGFNDSVMIANNALTSILASEEKTPTIKVLGAVAVNLDQVSKVSLNLSLSLLSSI